MRAHKAALATTTATALAAVGTLLNRIGDLPLSAVASTPQAVGDGKVWLAATSAVVADRPIVPSLAGFWIVGFGVLLLCSARLVVLAALSGHIVSALTVYGAIALVRVFDPSAFSSVLGLADYGLSAIIAAWIGAIAAVLWSRHSTRVGQAGVVLGAVACAGIGLACRPDVTALDSEHVVAFAIGAAIASTGIRSRLARRTRRVAALATAAWSLAIRGS